MKRSLLNRRNFLVGSGGAVLSLPFLEATSGIAQAQAAARPLRLVVVFHGEGTMLDRWTPTGTGATFQLSPLLEPLARFKNKLTVVSGIDNLVAGTMGGNGHNKAGRSLLTCQQFSKGGDNGHAAGPSIDQVIASRIQGSALFKSTNLNIGRCGGLGEYQLLFAGKDDPVGAIDDPRIAFDQLFSGLPLSPAPGALAYGAGGVTGTALRDKLRQGRGSVLDAVRKELTRLAQAVSSEDRGRLELHTDKIRELERIIKGTQGTGGSAGTGGVGPGTGGASGGSGGSSGKGGTGPGKGGSGGMSGTGGTNTGGSGGSGGTGGVVGCSRPDLGLAKGSNVCEHAREPEVAHAQIKNAVMALACDLTRVVTLQFLEYDSPTFPWLGAGIPGGYNNWHALIHRDGGVKAGRDDMAFAGFKYYSDQVAALLGELDSIDEGGSTLLDNTLVLWISEFGEGGTHDTSRLPVVLAGGLGGRVKTGQHVNFKGRTTNDLYTTILNLFGFNETGFGFGGTDLNHGPLSGIGV